MDNQELVETLFAAFSTFLSTEWALKRKPYNLNTSIELLASAPCDSTPRIFLDASSSAYLAYFVLKPKSAHAAGQAAWHKQFAALDNLSVKERKDLAQRISAVSVHPTLQNFLASTKKMANNAEDLLTEQPTQQPQQPSEEPLEHSSRETLGPKRRRIEGSEVEYAHAGHSLGDNSQAGQATSPTSANSTRYLDKGISGADVEELDIFPHYFRGCIRRDTVGDRRTAAISMNFPPDSIANVNCVMSIEVLPNKVERLAELFFKAHLETNGPVRELVLPHGVMAVTKQLQGSLPEAYREVLGVVIANALESAPFYGIEVAESGRGVATRCVTMTSFEDATKGAIISLTLGRRGASQIFEKLFRSRIKSRYAVQ